MLSRGDSENAVAVGRPPSPPSPARGGGFSAGDIRTATRKLDAWKRANPSADEPGPDDGWPRGYLSGFKTFVVRDDRARGELAVRHGKRLELLGRVESLPYTVHEQLISMALLEPKKLLAATPESLSYLCGIPSYDPDHASMVADLAIMLPLLKLLALLAATTDREYPVTLLLALSWLLAMEWRVGTASCPVPDEPPPRTLRPPGRLVLAEPHVARAPGRGVSLVVHRSEGRVGLCAPRGSAVNT
jgi:hypothetical protein